MAACTWFTSCWIVPHVARKLRAHLLAPTNDGQKVRRSIHTDNEIQPLLDVFSDLEKKLINVTVVTFTNAPKV